jgi:hypothetical protein
MLGWTVEKGHPDTIRVNGAIVASPPFQLDYDAKAVENQVSSVPFHVDAVNRKNKLLDRKSFTLVYAQSASAKVGTDFKVSYDCTAVIARDIPVKFFKISSLALVGKLGGDFNAEGTVTNETEASLTEGLKSALSINFGRVSLPGSPSFSVKGTASEKDVQVEFKLAFNVAPGSVLKDFEALVTVTAFELKEVNGKKEIETGNISFAAGAEVVYPPSGDTVPITINGLQGNLFLQGEVKLVATITPDWKEIGGVVAERLGLTALAGVLELGGATLFVEIMVWEKIGEVIYDIIADVVEAAKLDQQVKEANAAFANYYTVGLAQGESTGGALGGSDQYKQATAEGEAAGAAARGPMLAKFRAQEYVQTRIRTAQDDGATDAEIDKSVSDAFDDKVKNDLAAIEGQVANKHLRLVQTKVWLNYVGRQGQGYFDHARTLFSMWFLEGASLAEKFGDAADNAKHITRKDWFAIPGSVRKAFLALPGNWVTDPYPDGPGKSVGPPATQATVDKVWRWMQDHTQASAADYKDYEPNEVHLNADQIGQLNMKMAAQNSQ